MKNILITGYFGCGNIGDELMLNQYLKYKPTEDEYYYIQVRGHIHIDREIKNIKYVYQDFIDKNWNIFTDLIVCGGCHIANEYTPVMNNCVIAIKKGINVEVIAVSTASHIKSKANIEKIKFIVNKSSYFSVRDPYSLDLLVGIGCNKDKIRLDKDILYDYNYKSIIYPNNFKNDKKKLCFVPFVYGEYAIFFYRKIVNELINYCSRHDFKLTILNFWLFFSKMIDDNFNFKNVEHEIIKDSKDINYILSTIKSMDFFISEKYHASLISMELNIPTISICPNMDHYQFKMKYLHEYKQNNHLLYTRYYKDGDIQKELDKLLNE